MLTLQASEFQENLADKSWTRRACRDHLEHITHILRERLNVDDVAVGSRPVMTPRGENDIPVSVRDKEGVSEVLCDILVYVVEQEQPPLFRVVRCTRETRTYVSGIC